MTNNPTIDSLYKQARQRLAEAGCDSAALDARILLRAALGVSDADIIADGARAVPAAQESALDALIARRAAGEPVSRILGQREFWGLDFIVTPDTLDPRPDTETLVEGVLKRFAGRPPETILDLGTGTGCILIALLREFPQARGTAVDRSAAALDVARRNAAALGVADRMGFIESDWCESVPGSYDLIVSNPPYIPNPDIESLATEVRNHDPILALAGGDDGYDAYKIIVTEIAGRINPGGAAFLEVGENQGENVARLVEESNLRVERIIPDIAGIPRVVEISRGDN